MCPGIYPLNCQSCGKGAESVAQFMKHQVRAYGVRIGPPEFALIPCGPNLLKFVLDDCWTFRRTDEFDEDGSGDTKAYALSRFPSEESGGDHQALEESSESNG